MTLSTSHLCSIDDLTDADIDTLLQAARSFTEVNQRTRKKVPALRGVSIIMLFAEPSTRTRLSFELAAKRLSADTVSLSPGTSSLEKGESFFDTGRTLRAMRPDIVIVRHKYSGASEEIRRVLGDASIVNAGDGTHEHPTQALLDAYTLQDALGSLHNKRVVIVGDIAHSRVAGSNIRLLPRLGADVVVCGPKTMLPPALEQFGVSVSHDVDDAMASADAVMMLRMQKERMGRALIPSDREYRSLYGLHSARAARLKKGAVILHPGPMNRGVEIDAAVADSLRSRVLDQVSAGVAVRMAALYHLAARRSA